MNGLSPRSILRPLAEGFIDTFYSMVNRISDTQTSITYTVTHWESKHIPLGYQAELKLTLKYTGEGLTPPKRRAEDAEERHTCGDCGAELQIVRPGKYQCVNPRCPAAGVRSIEEQTAESYDGG